MPVQCMWHQMLVDAMASSAIALAAGAYVDTRHQMPVNPRRSLVALATLAARAAMASNAMPLASNANNDVRHQMPVNHVAAGANAWHCMQHVRTWHQMPVSDCDYTVQASLTWHPVPQGVDIRHQPKTTA